jgi:nitrogen regulatory protein P-II 1
MKLVEAIIKQYKLDEVIDALNALGVEGVTVSQVRGFGHQKGHTEIYRDAQYVTEFIHKVKLEIAVTDDLVAKVVEMIETAAMTGRIGDGKIFIFSLDGVHRIRTGEKDHDAI